ncbi:piRNA biogenesis protein EXD1 [Exaiptasia diaphana]|uniref:3'-5' exonuclease domain-containing protein n=1 Tax=Exaiptasia diaphana TaxID=2652724 RepID=A0A913Y2F5_EXADI|nr:piRNA biogenesis protein EXD1 [Exaiptasia diaphana]
MASGSSLNYVLVDSEVKLDQSLRELKSLEPKALLAVDCEGVDLTRIGELTIVAVATENKAFIFDVVKLKKAVFDKGLREILEDKTREKLMFDCRNDSDSLWHQYQVKLTGVLDVQLLEVMKRFGGYGGNHGVVKIRGFKHCLELYTSGGLAVNTKNEGRMLLQRDRNLWKRRPLSDVLLRYCAVDTLELFKLYRNLKGFRGEDLSRLRLASDRYIELFRSKAVRSFDRYENNGFLPLGVIGGGDTGFADTSCSGCRRLFPRNEFGEFQLRYGGQKCRVCTRVR